MVGFHIVPCFGSAAGVGNWGLHFAPPASVRGIYLSSWTASIPERRETLLRFSEAASLNTFVLDVKDSSGHVMLDTGDPVIQAMNVETVRPVDLREWIQALHRRNIYVIARLSVFLDPLYAKSHPDEAVQTADGQVWVSPSGASFVDPASKPFWDYIVRLSHATAAAGFDEINFDFVRYPDGKIADLTFPVSGPDATLDDPRRQLSKLNLAPSLIQKSAPTAREIVMTNFFKYLHGRLKSIGIPISADVFGLTTTNYDDLGIGQVLEQMAPYFDYLCPMTYPGYYPAGFAGIDKPAERPYETVLHCLNTAIARLKSGQINWGKIRPWLQDFSHKNVTYDAEKILSQKRAVRDAGLSSFLVWNSRSAYSEMLPLNPPPKLD